MEIIKINQHKIAINKIKIAAKVIQEGGIVAFPTETVYGLGADSFNIAAVEKIFKIKQRPMNDPLIVHIADIKQINNLAYIVPEVEKLCYTFWPGPLTLVLKKLPQVPDIVTAGLFTVAIRLPRNRIALELIKYSKTCIAAPSANLFGRPSPTTAEDVISDLNGKVDIIIDGGKTEFGVESTVLDLTVSPPAILRPGGITLEQLRSVLGRVIVKNILTKKKPSPGLFHKHYSPNAKVIITENITELKEAIKKYSNNRVALMITDETKKNLLSKMKDGIIIRTLGSKKMLKNCARNLFATMRELDKLGAEIILTEKFSSTGLGLAIMDRLIKAAG